jgi:hypothetical protein
MLAQQPAVRAADLLERLLGQAEVGKDVAILVILLDLDVAEHGHLASPTVWIEATTCVARAHSASRRSRSGGAIAALLAFIPMSRYTAFARPSPGFSLHSRNFAMSICLADARAAASRINGARSRGPKSPEGKARSAQNALKHGLRAQKFVVVGDESAREFAALEAALVDELAPEGTLQGLLAGRIARAAWRLERAERIEAELFAREMGDRNLGLALIRDGNGARALHAAALPRHGARRAVAGVAPPQGAAGRAGPCPRGARGRARAGAARP